MLKKQEYIITTNKFIDNKTIAVVSDFHINKEMNNKKIYKVLDTLHDIKPTHIVIPGDLYNVDRLTIREVPNNKVSLFIKDATDIADVYYVKGNIEEKSDLLPYHLYNNRNRKFHLLCEENYDFFNKKNGKVEVVKENDINIAGIRLPKDFYDRDEFTKKKILLSKYKKYLESISNQCGKDKFNVLLCHDPIIKGVLDILDTDFDLVISGHNHGGIFPRILKGPLKVLGVDTSKAYPTYTKGIYSCGEGSMMVSKGITKFHPKMGSVKHLEKFHNGTIETIKVYSKK